MSDLRSRLRTALGLVAVLALGLIAPDRAGPSTARAEAPPLVAAAADLQFALREVAAAFTAKTGETVELTFGSSGNFARQIQEGAPFEMFLSADETYVQDLEAAGLTRDEGTLYAIGRIVLIVPEGSPLELDGTLEDLRAAIADGRLKRFAIANPEHAPYGKRAEEALRRAGLWDAIQPFLVFGENVSQATQFATSGNAQGGIVAYALALAPEVARRGRHALIAPDRHEPLRQRMVLLKNAGPVAERFYRFVQAPDSRAILIRYGFVLPGEVAVN